MSKLKQSQQHTMIYTAENLFIVNVAKSYLESHGIDCYLKNDTIHSAGGEVPVGIYWPEIWIYDPALVTESKQLIKQFLSQQENVGVEWACQHCNETNEGHFHICWNCSQSRELIESNV